jgi:hypothetical protein
VTSADVDANADGGWRVRWKRCIARAALAKPKDGTARVRVPLPLAGAHAEVAIASVESSRAIAGTRRLAGALDVMLEDAPSAEEIDVTVTTTFRSSGAPPSADAATVYTSERDGVATITPWVRAFAASLGDDPVEGLWRILFEKMASGSIHWHEMDTRDPLRTVVERGLFDCRAGAALIVSSCRARGIPARLVGGVGLHPTAPFQHYWAEVFRDGAWQPFDVMSWDLACGALDDVAWSRRFFARVGPRMTTERAPDAIIGPPGFRAPAAWVILVRLTERGTAQSMFDAASGALVVRDEIDVETIA